MTNNNTYSLADEHWWGFAALPDGVDYPENGEDNPLTLICQFHHGDGMVSVLADLDYFFGDYDAPNGGMGSWPESFYKVIYSPDRSHLNEHAIRYSDGSSAVPEAEPMDAPLKRGEVSHIWGEPSYFTDEVAQDYPGYRVCSSSTKAMCISCVFTIAAPSSSSFRKRILPTIDSTESFARCIRIDSVYS